MRESEILKQILAYLKHINGRYFRINTGLTQIDGKYFTSAPKGTPDILGFDGRGYFVAIEVKSPKGRLSLEQKDFQQSVKYSENGIFILARSLEDVVEILR